jgi:hypothetical protein
MITDEDLRAILTRPIAFHRMFVSVGGSVGAGVFLSQLLYWSERSNDPNRWVYKTAADWFDETGLSRREVDTVRKALRTKGVIEEKLTGVPPVTHYRIEWEKLTPALKEAAGEHRERMENRRSAQFGGKRQIEGKAGQFGRNVQNNLAESAKLNEPKVPNQFGRKCQITNRSETSSEITPENTTTTTPRAKAKAVDPVEPPVVVVASLEASEEAEPPITAEELAELEEAFGLNGSQKEKVRGYAESRGVDYVRDKADLTRLKAEKNAAAFLMNALAEDWKRPVKLAKKKKNLGPNCTAGDYGLGQSSIGTRSPHASTLPEVRELSPEEQRANAEYWRELREKLKSDSVSAEPSPEEARTRRLAEAVAKKKEEDEAKHAARQAKSDAVYGPYEARWNAASIAERQRWIDERAEDCLKYRFRADGPPPERGFIRMVVPHPDEDAQQNGGNLEAAA